MSERFSFFQNREEDILAVSHLLTIGEAVALPTETVYGLAANALNDQAVAKIFAIKGRPLIDPLIVHVKDSGQACQVGAIPSYAMPLVEHFWPGPLTIIVPKKPSIPGIVTAGKPFVGIRMPSHTVFQLVLATCGLPLAAPSANPFGYISPTTAEHVRVSLGEKLPYILDGGPCEHGVESTIISFIQEGSPEILRPGPIEKEALEDCLRRKLSIFQGKKGLDSQPQMAPGLMSQHYSPKKPLYLFENSLIEKKDNAAIVHWKRPNYPQIFDFWLTETGDGRDAAKNLYNILQTLDNSKFDYIFVERPPSNSVLYEAIINRLLRAAQKINDCGIIVK